MTTQTFDGYYVFEADQVLTNDHLNQEFYYLDWQERLTRNKLIGTGIVCGLDITSAGGKIGISKGSAVTSEGYLIVLESPVTYDYFVQYAGVTQPADLPFAPDLPAGYVLPFYSTYCAPPAPAIYRLLDSTQYTVQNPLPVGSAALTTLTLSNYAVVLFVEMNEKDLKNCDTQDCNNKGEKMTITIQALLVPVSSLPNPFTTAKAKEIKLARYNVPYSPINNAADVLTSFYDILTNGVLDNLAASYAWCYDRYSNVLTDTQNPFTTGAATLDQQLNKALTTLWTTTNRITIQYLYDYINDLILAYYEFRETASSALLTQCVGHELDFPLHVVLGAANSTITDMTADPYRTYFIYSAIFDAQSQGMDRIQFLFNRMKMLVNDLNIQTYTETTDIRITPSQYMDFPLSERCIPFYYNPNADANGTAVNQVWNYFKTLHNDDDFILGYNSPTYNSDDTVVSPLLYDIEKYNFFRIEGHIGQQYSDVLSYLLNQQLTYNLPFDIVAISAELLSTANSTAIPECSIVDLDSEFRLLITEFLTKLFLCIYKFTIIPYQYANILASEGTFGVAIANMPDIDNEQFISNFNLEFSTYQYGDFYAKYAPFASMGIQTIGAAYVKAVQSGGIQNSTFNSPVNWFDGVNLSYMQGYNSIFQMLYAVDNLFYILLNTDLKDMNSASFSSAYEQYDKLFEAFATNNGQQITALTSSCGCECLVTIVESILVLLAEYQTRLQNYLAQLSFLNYYKSHPGLEHKSGVPKGGTFVLVYHEGPAWMYYDETTARAQLAANTGDVTLNTNSPAGTAPSETVNVSDIGQEFTLNADQVNNIWDLVEQCTDAPANTKQKIIGFLPLKPRPIQQQFPTIDNGAIIADFYIPYQCCSDCAPIAYMIDNKLNVYTVSGGGSTCANNANNNAAIGAVQLSGSDLDVNYNLYNSSDPTFKLTMTGTGNPLNFGIQTAAGTYTVTAVSADGNTKVNMNGSAVVALNPLPTAFNLKTPNGATSYCIGMAGVDIFLDGFQSGVQYQLYNGTTADPAGPVTPTSGSVVDFGVKPTGTYTVVATNLTTGCTNNMNNSVTITTATPPVAQTVTGGGSYCANNPGNGFAIGLADSENGVSYQLFNTVPGGTATPIGDSITSQGGAFNFPLQTAVGTYSVVATNAGGCITNMSNTVTIKTLPVPSSQIQMPPVMASIHDDIYFTATLTAVETDAVSLNWKVDSASVGSDEVQTSDLTKNPLVITIPRQLIGSILKQAKSKVPVTLNVTLTVTNGICDGSGATVDIWPAFTAYYAKVG